MTDSPGRPADRFARLAAMVRLEVARTARVVAEAEQARADFADREPPLRELRGIGDILHDFYTGIEHVFERIAPELNGGVPAGPAWHRRLLETMTLDLPGIRPPLLPVATARALEDFLRFRHLFRNVYGFELEWPKLRALLDRLPTAWGEVDAALRRFLEFLDAGARTPG
ncbi:MAG: hypothetical protein HY905_03615 [Deltaproteobacteria bacterium]|nr:hypothetical protein [Deltaproteobacteria bacterium]